VTRRRGNRFNPQNHTPRDRYFNSHFGPGGRPKVPFRSYAEALAFLARKGVEGSIYICNLCKQFHVGHLKPKNQGEA
jgi:hypothetical protein